MHLPRHLPALSVLRVWPLCSQRQSNMVQQVSLATRQGPCLLLQQPRSASWRQAKPAACTRCSAEPGANRIDRHPLRRLLMLSRVTAGIPAYVPSRALTSPCDADAANAQAGGSRRGLLLGAAALAASSAACVHEAHALPGFKKAS